MKTRPAYIIFSILLFSILVSPLNVTASNAYTCTNLGEENKEQHQNFSHRHEKRLDVTFPELEIVEGGPYCNLRMAEYPCISKPGHPRLPVKTVVLKLPLYSNVSEVAVDIKGTSTLNVSKPVSPAPIPVPLCTNETYHSTHSSDPAQPDSNIYNANELYPKDWFSYSLKKGLDPDTDTRVQYVIVWLYPVRYLPPANKIVLAEEASVVVYYEEIATVQSASSELENLIVTSPTLENQAVRLAAFKNSTGTLSRVVNTLWIYVNYPGVDHPEQIRNCIKDFVSQYNTLYITIFGDADQVPVRYSYIPDPHETYVSTDLYYADLDGTWDNNRDGLYADLRYDTVDGIPDVYVGRIPPSLVEYAEAAVDKIINFTENFNRAYQWANRIVLAAGTGDSLGSATTVLKEYIANMTSDMSVVKLYESSGNLTNANLKSKLDDGCLFLNFAGHGSPDSWLLRWIIWPLWSEVFSGSDAFSLTNGLKLPIIATMSCSTARFDDSECIGEYFVLNPDGGSIAYFGATRIAWGYGDEGAPYGLMGEMDWRIYESFNDGYTELGKMWGVSITRYIERNGLDRLYDYGYLDEKTVMEFSLLGDPTLSVEAKSVYTRTYLPPEWVSGGVTMDWHADDSSWAYTLPFDFPFYGTYYSTIYVSSNGLITFMNTDSSYSNSVPALAGKLAIAPAWDDWVTHEPYDIYIWQPESNCVAVRWEVRAYGSSVIANFETILDTDGVIKFNYGYSNGTVSATVGISNGADDILAENVTNLNHINTIVFTPPPTRRARIYIDPKDNIFYTDTTFTGDQFNVSIMAADWTAPGVYAYELRLYYNNSLLEAIDAWIPEDHFLTPEDPAQIFIIPPEIHEEEGYVYFGATLLDDEPGKTGSGILSKVTFNIIRAPSAIGSLSCLLELRHISIIDPDLNEIPSDEYEVNHGNYEYVSRGVPPIQPMYIYGYVFVDGRTAPQGFNVSARVNTTLVDSVLTDATGYYGPLEISVETYGGQTVSLYVQQIFIQNETVRSGAYRIDLTVTFNFDFGTDSSPVEAGYTQTTPSTLYSVSSSYGWNSSDGLYSRDRGSPDDLRRDFVFSWMDRTFKVDLPNGDYLVTVLIGDLLFAHDQICIYAEGVLEVNVSVNVGEFVEKTFIATLNDGQLNMVFHDDGGSDANWIINALTIKRYTANKFDFGTESSPVETGYVQVTASTIYSSSTGYGWTTTDNLYSRDRLSPDNIRRDFVFSSVEKTFRVDLPSGTYLVMIITGDQHYLHDNVLVYAENELKATVSTRAGEFVQKVFVVSVGDGALDLTFKDAGGSDSNWVVNAILVEQYIERKFDFGSDSSPVELGYAQVTPSTMYYTLTGYGWENTLSLYARDRSFPDDLRRDFVFSSISSTFKVDLSNGKYMIIMIVGDNDYHHDSINIYCQGNLVVNNLAVEKGYFTEVIFLAEVSDGQLEIMFHDAGGTDPNWIVNAIYIKTTFGLRVEFDLGTDDSPVEDGYARVTTTAYSASTGYGWSNVANLQSRDRGAPDALRRDFVFSSFNRTFNVDLLNGNYQVTLIVGDQSFMHDKIDIYAEGVIAAHNVTVSAGAFTEITFTITVNDGQLNITFHDGRGLDANWVINAILIDSYQNS